MEIQELKGQLEEAKEELKKLQQRNFDNLEKTQKRGRGDDRDTRMTRGGAMRRRLEMRNILLFLLVILLIKVNLKKNRLLTTEERR